jgi:hypothetical protein
MGNAEMAIIAHSDSEWKARIFSASVIPRWRRYDGRVCGRPGVAVPCDLDLA